MASSDRNLSVYLAHRGELVYYATAIVGDRSRGEDVVQEPFLRFPSSAGERALDEPLGYLRRIVRNLAIDWTRRLSSERRTVDDKAEYGSIAADRPLPEDALVSRDELRLVMEAMAELLERTRIALMMHRFDGFKLRDIAAPLGISGRTCPRAGL